MKNNFLLLIFVFFAISLHAQDTLVVDAALPDSEFHVAINPMDSNNIIIATMHGGSTGDMKVYYTLDQGASWQTSPFTGVHPGYQGAGDPVLDFDAFGKCVFGQSQPLWWIQRSPFKIYGWRCDLAIGNDNIPDSPR
jgi:hypothetical protein